DLGGRVELAILVEVRDRRQVLVDVELDSEVTAELLRLAQERRVVALAAEASRHREDGDDAVGHRGEFPQAVWRTASASSTRVTRSPRYWLPFSSTEFQTMFQSVRSISAVPASAMRSLPHGSTPWPSIWTSKSTGLVMPRIVRSARMRRPFEVCSTEVLLTTSFG